MAAATLGLVGRPADQLHENVRTSCDRSRHGNVTGGASSRPVAAARLVLVQGWHTSPHGGSGTLRTAAAAPRVHQLAAMPRLALHATAATPGGGGMPCPAAHASDGRGHEYRAS